MGWLDSFMRVGETDESGERIIIPAHSTDDVIDDIKQKADGNITFGKNAIHKIELDKYRNRSEDRHNTKYLLSLHGKEIPEGYDCHHAGDAIIEVVKDKVHRGLTHKLYKKG